MARIIDVKMDGVKAYVEYAASHRTYDAERIPETVKAWALERMQPADGVRVWDVVRDIEGNPCSELVYGSREQVDAYTSGEGYDVWSVSEATEDDVRELIETAGLLPVDLSTYEPPVDRDDDQEPDADDDQDEPAIDCDDDQDEPASIVLVSPAPLAVVEEPEAVDDEPEAPRADASKVAKAIARKVLAGVAMGAKAAISAAPVVLGGFKMVMVATINVIFRLGFILMDVWYWMTTYLPIGARRVWFWLVWDFAPVAVKAAKEAVKVAKATARASTAIAAALAGWGAVAVLTGAGAAMRACRAICVWAVSGWAMREEIIQEMAA